MRGLEDVFLKPDLLRYSDSNYELERLQLQKTKYGIIIWNVDFSFCLCYFHSFHNVREYKFAFMVLFLFLGSIMLSQYFKVTSHFFIV